MWGRNNIECDVPPSKEDTKRCIHYGDIDYGVLLYIFALYCNVYYSILLYVIDPIFSCMRSRDKTAIADSQTGNLLGVAGKQTVPFLISAFVGFSIVCVLHYIQQLFYIYTPHQPPTH